MKTIKIILLALLIVACSSNDEDNYQREPINIETKVLSEGTSVGQTQIINHPQTNEILEAKCFMVDLFDPESMEIIGTLQDCVIDRVDNGDGTITSWIITTINLNGRGTIVIENQVLHIPTETEDIFRTNVLYPENNIIDGTNEFQGITGTVYLYGETDFSQINIGIVAIDGVLGLDYFI